MKPLVSVLMLVYNHEKYLSAALDSILMQKRDFPIEIVIGDDCSTDDSFKILEQYQSAYPEIIRVIRHSKNIGAMNNHKQTMTACSGEYVAICEGDDYWTDAEKLKMQVDTMEAKPGLSFCCHRVDYYYEDLKKTESWGAEYFTNGNQYREITLDTLFEPYLIRTVSVLYRASMIDNDIAVKQDYFKDLFLFSMLLSNGNAVFIYRVMAVYRIHGQGIWSGQGDVKNLESNVKTAVSMTRYFQGKFKVVDDYAFVQSSNLLNLLHQQQAPRNHQLISWVSHQLIFQLNGKLSFTKKLRYSWYWITALIK